MTKKITKPIVADITLIAKCGLYCGACGAYLSGRCPGCAKNVKATWCQIRSCCGTANIASCASCADFSNPLDCRKYNNLISKVIGFILRSNRSKCIARIREIGLDAYALEMAKTGRQSLPR